MTALPDLEIFVVTFPGLEPLLCAEMRDKGFQDPTPIKGGVTTRGPWPEVWRANLELRGASRVLVRIASFRALHLAQLDKRARRQEWADLLRADVPVRVEAACKGSRIYHAGAAAQRIATAIHETMAAPISDDAEVCLKARIEDDLCTISVDTSGESLHKRGHKEAVNKAPLRETLAALFLRHCGYDGRETVVDPMCGSGTFVIEAAEIAAGLAPGRSRRFAFEALAGFDQAAWAALRARPAQPLSAARCHGSDRDAGAIRMSIANAERAGIAARTDFTHQAISDLQVPAGPPGLVMVNPPYGHRVGNQGNLRALYHALGQTLLSRFSGWRVGLVTSEPTLARATGLPFTPPDLPVSHGGLRVGLYRTAPLP
jgi:putative N6-adenine-specific DNA methylase